MDDHSLARQHPDGDRPRWAWRVTVLALILATLFASSLAAGAAGAFSSATRRLQRDLQDPATRLAAATALADQFASDFAGNHPTLPGTRDEQTCPAAYAARASALVGSLAPADAAAVMQSAQRRLSATRWRLDQRRLDPVPTLLSGHNRRGIDVVISEQAGDQTTTIQVTVSVQCPSAVAAPTTSRSRAPTSTVAGG